MADNLVFVRNGQALVTSATIAAGVEIKHQNVLALVRKYQSDFEAFGIFTFETWKLNGGRGRPETVALLNEQQATLLVTYCKNTEIVRRFKVALVKAFYEARQTQLTVTTGDTLTPAQQLGIRNAVAARAQKEPAKYKEIYSALKRRFQVARYDQIMKEDYEEALTFIREMQLTAQLPARPKQNEAEPVVVNDQEVRYELGMTRAEIESFGQFIYCWKYLFRPSLVTFRELLSAVHSPLAGNLYDATFDTTLNRIEEVFRKHGIPVGPEHLSSVLPYHSGN